MKRDIIDTRRLPTVPGVGVPTCSACPMFHDDEIRMWCNHPATDGGTRLHSGLVDTDHSRAPWCPLDDHPLTIHATPAPDVAEAATLSA